MTKNKKHGFLKKIGFSLSYINTSENYAQFWQLFGTVAWLPGYYGISVLLDAYKQSIYYEIP